MKKINASALCTAVTLSLSACADSKKPYSENIIENNIEYAPANEKDFEYEENYVVTNTYGVEITKYKGDGGNIITPKELGGKPVRSIGDNAFNSDKKITGVYIPAGLFMFFPLLKHAPTLQM